MDLKPYYDKVLSLQSKTQGIIAKIDDALNSGMADGEEQALAMQGDLEAAIAEQEKAESFYNTLLKGSKTSTNPVRNFLPVEQSEIEEEHATPKIMKRSEFQALTPKERLAYVNADGKIED